MTYRLGKIACFYPVRFQCVRWVVAGVLTLSIGSQAFAHGRYMLPSHTVLSGDGDEAVTLTASISNEVLHADRPFGDDGKSTVKHELGDLFNNLQYRYFSPDGEAHNMAWRAYARLSVGDLVLKPSGTYRVSMYQPTTHMLTFKNADGSPGRIFGAKAKLPDGAKDAVRRSYESRVEAFITYNQASRDVLEPTGKGLELVGETHPNDLFAGEPVTFRLALNGKPLTLPAHVVITRDGTRHRNQRDSIVPADISEGKFEVIFDQPGYYFLEAEVEADAQDDPAVDKRGYALYLTLEVFPE